LVLACFQRSFPRYNGLAVDGGTKQENSVQRGARIAGWGRYVPERVLTNHDLEQMVDTSDEWITSRTGIRERRIVADHEGTASMVLAASAQALQRAGVSGSAVQLVIVATVSPDYQFPAVACLLQAALGAQAGAFDLQAGCSGFVYALVTGLQFIRSGVYDRVLVAGGDTLSRLLDWTDRSTCVLFGDGAGAVYLEATTGPGDFLGVELGSEGSNPAALYMDSIARPRATCLPPPAPATATGLPALTEEACYIKMDGREVFRFASRILGEAVRRVTEAAGWSLDEIDAIIPHQANLRIIQSASKTLGIPLERFYVNVDRYGNTSNGSVPVALCEAVEAGAIRPGSRVVLASFGAGLTWAATAVRWSGPAYLAVAAAGATNVLP
jgi:3-oxoacyl-[acyl-carrier-protein] synthase III